MFVSNNPNLEKLENSCYDALGKSLSTEEAFSFEKFNEKEVEQTGFSNYSYWASTFRVFCKNKVALAFVFLVATILLFTFIQPYLPNQFDSFIVNNDEFGIPLRNEPPGDVHLMGTNSIGQDLWARLWHGTRTSLLIGMAVAIIEAVVGITIGVLWGYVRKLDFIFTELYNVVDNIPSTIILILMSYIFSPGVFTIIIALSLVSWIRMARFTRNQILIIRDREYNLASRCLGTPIYRVILKNLLPYLVSVIMLRMALSIPMAIGLEVFITYIGLGLPATIPSLGNLITDGRALMMSPTLRYQLIYPTIILSIVTISFYVVGSAFSDAADPKNHR